MPASADAPESAVASVWDAVVGQDRAVRQLQHAAADPVHAYLFVGPPGSTKDEAARAFAAVLLGSSHDAHGRDARLAMAGVHPDVREVQRVGARILNEQIDEIIRAASMAPVESDRKVIILHEFHLLDDVEAARLLKTIEEPPASTVFIVLADQLPPELVTIASRCVRISFGQIAAADIEATLAAEDVSAEMAASAAGAAGGDLTRARVLATDPDLMARRDAFAAFPTRLDGTGRTVVALCAEATALIEAAAKPLVARQTAEAADVEARVRELGERGSGRKQLEDRHKRELRRHRMDEWRSGLAVMAAVYRDVLVANTMPRPHAPADAVHRIHAALEALDRNPNETLLLQSLLLDLPSLG